MALDHLEQGAIGMSSGLFYAVSNAASTDEVAEVAAPLGKWGGVYTAHMRDEGDHILAAMDETFEIGRRAGAEIIVSHHKCSGRSNFGRMVETLPKFTDAMKKQQIAFDVYPYVAGSTILRSDMLDRADKVLITWSDKVEGMKAEIGRGIEAEEAEALLVLGLIGLNQPAWYSYSVSAASWFRVMTSHMSRCSVSWLKIPRDQCVSPLRR